jgi:hypothetical protein
MTDISAAPERARAGGRQTLIDRYDLVAALDRAAGNQVTIISAPAGSGKPSLLRVWAHRRGREGRVVPHDVETGDPPVPGVRPQQRGEDPHQRRLARAIRAEQAQHPPRLDVQTHADERLNRAERLANALDLDHGVRPRQRARLADRGCRRHLNPLVLRPAIRSPSRSPMLRIMNSSL